MTYSQVSVTLVAIGVALILVQKRKPSVVAVVLITIGIVMLIVKEVMTPGVML